VNDTINDIFVPTLLYTETRR